MHTWKPDFILATEHLDPQVSHCRKNNRVSFCKIVSGDRQVWHVTYSLIYLKIMESLESYNLNILT